MVPIVPRGVEQLDSPGRIELMRWIAAAILELSRDAIARQPGFADDPNQLASAAAVLCSSYCEVMAFDNHDALLRSELPGRWDSDEGLEIVNAVLARKEVIQGGYTSEDPEVRCLFLASLIASFFSTLSSAASLLKVRRDARERVSEYEHIVHKGVHNTILFANVAYQWQYATGVARTTIRALTAAISEMYPKDALRDAPFRQGDGPFASIRVAELEALAARETIAIARYGEAAIAKEFERQLALIAASFGFIVIETRTAERAVDLVCISADPGHPATVLIEAKTSKKSYALPAKDERALIEYVTHVRSGLRTLPKLEAVLLIGGSAASTLETKLQALEARCGTPVRFWEAKEVARLRNALPGPVPMDALLSGLKQEPRVFGPDLTDQIARRYTEVQDIHRQVLRTMMRLQDEGIHSARGVS